MLDLQAGAAEGDGQVEAGHDAGVDLGSAVKRSIGSTTGCTSRFQPGEGPSRGLLCDYEPWGDAIRMQLFEALIGSTPGRTRSR